MIFGHVVRRAKCVYSQLKRCSSSEVASMIEGVLRHCTDMELQRQYVDSHGHSAVGLDRTSVVQGKRVSVRVDLGGGRIVKKSIERHGRRSHNKTEVQHTGT